MDLVNVYAWVLSTPAGPYVLAGLTVLGGLVTIASVIAPFTKTPKDDEAVAWLKKYVLRFTVINPKP